MATFGSSTALLRSGQVSFEGERTVWLHAADGATLADARPLVSVLQRRHPRQQFVLTVSDPAARPALARDYPDGIVLPPPWPLAACAKRYLNRLNVRLLILLGSIEDIDGSVIRAAGKRGVPIVVAGDRSGPLSPVAVARLAAIDHFFVPEGPIADALRAAGVSPEHITRLAPSLEPSAAVESVAAGLSPLLGRDLKRLRSKTYAFRGSLEKALMASLDRSWGRGILSARLARIDDLAALRRELGHPRSILCLGNGPSSEDPRLLDITHDALFRVNDMWLTRGFLNEPDMIFTGSRKTLARIKRAIFGFQTVESEARLVRHHVFGLHLSRLRYATLERFPLFLYQEPWRAVRPTNGAAMLATAVALQPERLIVSGVDLFAHPQGSYPGDANTPNAYTPGHDPDTELQLLMLALQDFSGDLVILSEALEEAWREFQSRKMRTGVAAQNPGS
jgi:hypothetical protein